MARPIKLFDPSLNLGGSSFDTKGINVNEQLMLYNDSIYGLELTFPDGSVDRIPPSWNKDFILNDVAIGVVKWTIFTQLNVPPGVWPISQVYGSIYETGEHVASVNASMQRGVTVASGSVGATVNTLSNETNAAGVEVIDIGTLTNPKLIDIFTDHGSIGTEQAGVAAQVFKWLNGILEILNSLKLDTTPVTMNGTTAGTFSLWQPFIGDYKLLILQQVGYQNSASDPGPMLVPTPFTKGGLGLHTNIGGWTVKNGGATISTDNATSFGAGSSSNPTPSWTWYAINSAFDRLQPNLSNGTVHNAWGFILGV